MMRAASLLVSLSLLAACRNAPRGEPEGSPLRVDTPTYNEHVAPILFARCATCHRPIDFAEAGGTDPLCIAGAPFSVLDYASVARRAKAIAAAVQQRRMPPWLPEAGHGDFVNERRLRDDEIATLTAWASHGAPEGEAAKRPAIPHFPTGWQLGTPDLVLSSAEPYAAARA